MSSSNTGNQLSSIVRAGQLVFSALRTGASPVSAAVTGGLTVARFLAYTTLGRATVLVVLLLGTFTYFKSHFTQMERHEWKVEVAEKQKEIVGKVAAINTETRAAQKSAQAEVGFWNRIFAVVADGIWKTQPPHPIESQTIDLINETRGPAKK
jgi:hypothetical protein